MLLQRSPLVRVLADMQFTLGPRAAQMVRALLTTGISVGAINTVTAATGDLTLTGSTTGNTGEEMLVLVTPAQGGALEFVTPGFYDVVGELPTGLELFPVDNRNQPSIPSFAEISGTPIEAGVFMVTIQAFQGSSVGSGDSGNILNVTFTITQSGPVVTTQPADQVADWGGEFTLTVAHETATGTASYQWQKQHNVFPDQYITLDGETGISLSVNQLRTIDGGKYRVRITDDTGTNTSANATVTILSSSYDFFRELNFSSDPFSTEADLLSDPDLDTRTNLEEHLFGLNPNQSETREIPRIERELIGNNEYIVYRFPAVPSIATGSIAVEMNTTPDTAGWAVVPDGTNGLIIEDGFAEYIVKVPVSVRQFVRLKFSDT